MAIITSNEVIKYSIAERAFPTDKVERMLNIIETKFMRDCVGIDFYELLKDDQINWATAQEWEPGTYAEGDLAWWEDDIFESTEDANATEPSLINPKWKPADKFNTSEYNNLYKLYLRPIIANEIIRITAPLETIKLSAKGAVMFTEDQSNTIGADSRSIDSILRHLKDLIELQKSEMIEYVILQQEKYDSNQLTGFNYRDKKIKIIECDSCHVSTRQGRRVAFKH